MRHFVTQTALNSASGRCILWRGNGGPTMRFFLIGMLVLLCAGIGWAQDGVTVSSNNVTVTAAFGDFSCVFISPIFFDLIHITCFKGTTEVLFTKVRPQIGQDITGQVG